MTLHLSLKWEAGASGREWPAIQSMSFRVMSELKLGFLTGFLMPQPMPDRS